MYIDGREDKSEATQASSKAERSAPDGIPGKATSREANEPIPGPEGHQDRHCEVCGGQASPRLEERPARSTARARRNKQELTATDGFGDTE